MEEGLAEEKGLKKLWENFINGVVGQKWAIQALPMLNAVVREGGKGSEDVRELCGRWKPGDFEAQF